jgi:hypothetical protein
MSAEGLRFDAEWWNHVNGAEQQGFIYGYLDCRQLPKAAKASISDYQDGVTAAMKLQEANAPNAVAKAIEHASQTPKSRDTRGAENYDGPHGFLDGEWWGGFHGRPWPSELADADRGYVEGYLECVAPPVTVEAVRRYQKAINQHYASRGHERDKVADLLQTLLTLRSRS